jgi:flagellar motor switch protein FliG
MNERGGKEERTGTERAAILLLTLGEQEAAQVLKHMGAKEVQRIGTAMSKLKGVSREEVTVVVSDFNSSVESQTAVGVGTDEFLRKVLVDALIRLEHPQIISIVLAYLDSDHAAEVLGHLPANVRPDVIVRIATLDGVQPSALSELDDIMEKQFSGKQAGLTSSMGGAKAAADIINNLEPSTEGAIMEQISKADAALGQRIQDLIFVFDNLIELDDRSMQELLRQVPGDRLMLAMKGSEDALKEKIFKNMSQRAAEMLKDDLEAKGPVRISEVEAAQKEILAAARKLAEAGTINLGGKGEEYV